MADEQDDESNLEIANDVLAQRVTRPAILHPLKELHPWHRPRKQWIRTVQWRQRISYLIESLEGRPEYTGGSSELNYLTLPGIDYFDVRVIADLCKERNWHLTSTAFLAVGEDHPIMARAQYRETGMVEAGHISQSSTILPYAFETLSSIRSQAYKSVRQRAPYHAVNIDACGSLAPTTNDDANRLVEAIHRVAELQFRLSKHSWLLFVTTDVKPDNFHPDTLNGMLDIINENANENPDFADLAPTALVDNMVPLQDAIDSALGSPGLSFTRLFAMGIGKWLLHLAKEKDWAVKMHPSYCYSTPPGATYGPNMPSLAFEFIPPPIGLVDQTGISRAVPAPGGNLEDLSLRVAQHVSRMIDLDSMIAADGGLNAEMTKQTRDLLAEAGYPENILQKLDQNDF